jgi:hypothetical protein
MAAAVSHEKRKWIPAAIRASAISGVVAATFGYNLVIPGSPSDVIENGVSSPNIDVSAVAAALLTPE